MNIYMNILYSRNVLRRSLRFRITGGIQTSLILRRTWTASCLEDQFWCSSAPFARWAGHVKMTLKCQLSFSRLFRVPISLPITLCRGGSKPYSYTNQGLIHQRTLSCTLDFSATCFAGLPWFPALFMDVLRQRFPTACEDFSGRNSRMGRQTLSLEKEMAGSCMRSMIGCGNSEEGCQERSLWPKQNGFGHQLGPNASLGAGTRARDQRREPTTRMIIKSIEKFFFIYIHIHSHHFNVR